MRHVSPGVAVAVLIIGLLAAACTGGDPDGEEVARRDGSLGGVDLSIHNVPLEDIHFDTFDGGSVPLSEISEGRLLSLEDVIPPLDSPKYDDASSGDWLDDDDLIIGYRSAAGMAWAYPIKILNFHEIVNDDLDGTPVLISYCPLCRSGIVYDRRLDSRELTFSNTSALYENDLVMFDRETRSYWWQVAGEAIVGTLTGSGLDVLPSITTTWSAWKTQHPDTLVLSRNTGYSRPYEREVFEGYRDSVNDEDFPFPVSGDALDGRLAPGDEVLGVTVKGESQAYPLRALGDAAVNDRLGGEPIVVFSSEDGPSGGAYSRMVDGEILTFEFDNGRYVDTQTGTEWNLSGTAVRGTHEGKRLEPLPSRYTFWFAYIAALPNAEVYTP